MARYAVPAAKEASRNQVFTAKEFNVSQTSRPQEKIFSRKNPLLSLVSKARQGQGEKRWAAAPGKEFNVCCVGEAAARLCCCSCLMVHMWRGKRVVWVGL